MDFKQYPSYKDSGVEWLGEVPRHWILKPIKFLSKINQSTLAETTDENLDIQYVDIGSVSATYGIEKIEQYVFSKAPSRARRIVADKDIIVSTVRTYLKAITYIENPPKNLIVSTGFAVLTPIERVIKPQFAKSAFLAEQFIAEVISKSKGISYPAITASELAAIKIALPPIKEQNQIISFLDSETSRIDNLIAKQEKLIEKLEEHRKSVISHAVTKGLDPNVPMKDSDVEWLGEVPEHWKLLQTRHIFNFGKGLTITKENLSDEGIPCINYGEVHSKYGFEFNPSDNPLKCVSYDFIESNKNCLLNKGDFIFADTSEDLEGSGNFSHLNQEAVVFAGYHTIIARPKNGLNHRYLAYMIDSQAYRGQIRAEMKGVKVYSVSQGVLKSRLAWLPPIEEQDQIVKLLDEKTSKIDTLIAKQRELIAKLKNYRTSIISHAVTGKIDVRDLVA